MVTFVSVHSYPSAQLRSRDTDRKEAGSGFSDSEESCETTGLAMQTPLPDRLQVLHGHEAARGQVPGTVLLQHGSGHPRTCRKHKVCSEVRRGAHGGSHHECQLPRAGTALHNTGMLPGIGVIPHWRQRENMVTVSRDLEEGGGWVMSSERKLESFPSGLHHLPTMLLAQGKRAPLSGR